MTLLFALLLCLCSLPTLLLADTPPPVDTIQCTVVWECAGETDDYLLGGLLVDAGWNRQGQLCVVDYMNKDLKVFSPDGEYLRTLGREGEGPGEVRDARLLLEAEDGRLGLLQMFPATVVWLKPDGSPAGRLVLKNNLTAEEGYVGVPHAVQYGGSIMAFVTVMALTSQGPTEHHWIAPMDLTGGFGSPQWHQRADSPQRDAKGRVNEVDLYSIWASRWAPDGTGGVWVAAERDRYRIEHNAADGTPLPPIELEYDPAIRDDLGRHQAVERLVRKRHARNKVVLSDADPVVHRLRLADDGNLWVDLSLGGRGPEPDTIAMVDVWSQDGHWQRRLLVRGDFDPDTDQRLFVDDQHVLVLSVDQDDEVRLRLLKLDAAAAK